MTKFFLIDQDAQLISETEYKDFICGILELGGYYVVNVVPLQDGRGYTAAVYRDIKDAAAALEALQQFALTVHEPNQCWAFPKADMPVSPLEIIDTLCT